LFTSLFVYFGRELPRFLVENLRRTCEIFLDARVVVVTNAKKNSSVPKSVNLLHPEEVSWSKNRPTLDRDMRFWGGWWQKTFDRLLMIHPVHELFPERSLIQVEADTILFPSLLGSPVIGQKKVAYPMFSADRAVASIVYSGDPSLSRLLNELLLKELAASRDTTDMHALSSIRSKLGGNFIELAEFPSTASQLNSLPNPDKYGLFDGASHGEWICGRDPKAHWGVGKRKLRTPISQGMQMPQYAYEAGQLFLLHESDRIPVNNLHIHSKELFFFGLTNDERYRDILSQVNSPSEEITSFQIFPFFFCLVSRTKILTSSFFSRAKWRKLMHKLSQ
jgi:hypothetical protein